LRERFEHLGGYTIEAQARAVLTGLGFRESDLARNTEEFSGGWLMRIALAKILLRSPDILLLDEPTNHLDVAAQLALLSFVARLGTTSVAALHDLNLAAAFCEHVLVLSHGRLVAAGHPVDVLRPALLREVYGVDADVLEHPRTGRPVIAFATSVPVAP
jgi:iron complex transport system ATP-binding protein